MEAGVGRISWTVFAPLGLGIDGYCIMSGEFLACFVLLVQCRDLVSGVALTHLFLVRVRYSHTHRFSVSSTPPPSLLE